MQEKRARGFDQPPPKTRQDAVVGRRDVIAGGVLDQVHGLIGQMQQLGL